MEPFLDEIETTSKKGVNNIGVDIVRENVWWSLDQEMIWKYLEVLIWSNPC
jgi:hypothetical protein